MSTDSSKATRDDQEEGLTQELNAYARRRELLLNEAKGQFVVVSGDEVVGPVKTLHDAEELGFSRFGNDRRFMIQLIWPGMPPIVYENGVGESVPRFPEPSTSSQAFGNAQSSQAFGLRYLTAEEFAKSPTPPGQRPRTDFKCEREEFRRVLPELLSKAEGQFVVLVGKEIEGPVATFEEAIRAGWRRFGLGPIYVKQVVTEELENALSGCAPCQS